MKYKIMHYLFTLFIILGNLTACEHSNIFTFSGENALNFIDQQVKFGPRIPGSEGSIAAQNMIQKTLESKKWIIEKQDFMFENTSISNIIAKSSNNPPDLIIGAHYDTRAVSDNESLIEFQATPVPGANDGASGTAILLELGRIIDRSNIDLWLVFFDAEDQGNLNGWEWSIGAQFFADNLEVHPSNVIIIDMVGDKELEIYRETTSSKDLSDSIWNEAEALGYENIFKQTEKYSIIDDHSPFLNIGIPASLIIDIEYPEWHRTSDTIDKVSASSLEIVGNVVYSWLVKTYY